MNQAIIQEDPVASPGWLPGLRNFPQPSWTIHIETTHITQVHGEKLAGNDGWEL